MSEADIQEAIRRSLLQSNPPIRNEESDFERALQLSLQEAHKTAKRKEEEKKIKQLVTQRTLAKERKKDAFMTYQNYGSKIADCYTVQTNRRTPAYVRMMLGLSPQEQQEVNALSYSAIRNEIEKDLAHDRKLLPKVIASLKRFGKASNLVEQACKKETQTCLNEIDKISEHNSFLLPEDAVSYDVRKAIFHYILSLPLKRQREILAAFVQAEEKKSFPKSHPEDEKQFPSFKLCQQYEMERDKALSLLIRLKKEKIAEPGMRNLLFDFLGQVGT